MNIADFFYEPNEPFTIFVAEQHFVVGQGYEFFKSYVGKENYIKTDNKIKRIVVRVLNKIHKHSPNIGHLIGICFPEYRAATVIEAIMAISQVFSVHEHQAVGPEVLDPIIIEEKHISYKYISHLVALHKESILRPAIIILLKDNDFDRAKEMLKGCPNGTNVKLIRNSGICEIYKVINSGAANVNDFLDAFSGHCFSTCSCTPRNILLGKEWDKTSLVNLYVPSILRIRSNLLFDEKDYVKDEIVSLLYKLENTKLFGFDDEKLIETFICILKLFKVYAFDFAGNDLQDALELATDLRNDVLKAQVYRYANFFDNLNRNEKSEMLDVAKKIFTLNKMDDHAIYCENNKLFHQFYSDNINIRQFCELQQEAIHNVPGLVGMSIIYNNVGVAHLYTGNAEDAIYYFNKGTDYARQRIIQKLGLEINCFIANDYLLNNINDNEIISFIRRVFDNFGTSKFCFITANYLVNAVAIVIKHNFELVNYIFANFDIKKILRNALAPHNLGTGTLSKQIEVLITKYNVTQLSDLPRPSKRTPISGIRERFIENHGCNPLIFNAWI